MRVNFTGQAIQDMTPRARAPARLFTESRASEEAKPRVVLLGSHPFNRTANGDESTTRDLPSTFSRRASRPTPPIAHLPGTLQETSHV
jgi:hypothetical protein